MRKPGGRARAFDTRNALIGTRRHLDDYRTMGRHHRTPRAIRRARQLRRVAAGYRARVQGAAGGYVRERARCERRAAERGGAQGRRPHARRGAGRRGQRLGQRDPDDARDGGVHERRDGAPARRQRYLHGTEPRPSERHDFRARRRRRSGGSRRQIAHRGDRPRIRRLLQLLRDRSTSIPAAGTSRSTTRWAACSEPAGSSG